MDDLLGKSGSRRRFEEFEMRNHRIQVFNSALGANDFGIKEIKGFSFVRLAVQIFVDLISHRHTCSCDHIVEASFYASLLALGRAQRFPDCRENRTYASAIGLSVAFRGTRLEFPLFEKAAYVSLSTCPQKWSKHDGVLIFKLSRK
jgi:hypothetical protein